MSLDGVLEKRGAFRRWAPVALRLRDDKLHHVDVKEIQNPNATAKEVLVVQHVEKMKDTQMAFKIHFSGSSGNTKDTNWLLRCGNPQQYDKWMSTLVDVVKRKRAGAAAGPGGAAPQNYDYGLPPTDPRTDLPIAPVPPEHAQAFAFLNMAVIHWFGMVKRLKDDFGTEDCIAVLGDKCVYVCSPQADVLRCVRVTDVQKVLVAQDSKKELYSILVVKPVIELEGKPDAAEFDLMFHSHDIKRFVRFLRTVYVHQTGKMLPLEQLRDKSQLEKEIRLAKPDSWILNYWQPLFKEHLKQILDMWETSNKKEENDRFKQQVAQMLDQSDCMGLNLNRPAPGPGFQMHQNADLGMPPSMSAQQQTREAPAPERAAPIETQKVESESGDDDDDDDAPAAGAAADDDDDAAPATLPPGAENTHFGRLLLGAGLPQYYTALAVDNKMTIDLLQSELIDESDLKHFGVANAAHRKKILQVVHDEDAIAKAKVAAAAGGGGGGAKAKGRGAPADESLALDDDDLDDLDLADDSLFLGAGGGGGGGGGKSRGLGAGDKSAVFDDDMDFDLDLDDDDAGAAPVAPDLAAHASAEERARADVAKSEAAKRADLEAACSAFAPAESECDTSTPLGKFLSAIKLPQYYEFLTSRDIELETLACGLVDDGTLKLFGIEDAGHRKIIMKGLDDPALLGEHKLEWIGEHERSPTEATVNVEICSRKELSDTEGNERTALMQDFVENMPAPTDIDSEDPLGRFLKAIGLPQYYWGMTAKDMSLDVMTCDLMDDDDLKNHLDIENAADRRRLRIALKDTSLVARVMAGEVPENSWSIEGEAKARIRTAQNKITEIGGLGLALDDDLLGGGPPAAAAAAPSKEEKPAAPAGEVDLLGAKAPSNTWTYNATEPAPAAATPAPAAGGMDDLLGGPPAAPAAAAPAPAAAAPVDAADDLLGGGAPAPAPAAAAAPPPADAVDLLGGGAPPPAAPAAPAKSAGEDLL